MKDSMRCAKAVFAERRQVVDETIALYRQDGKPLPSSHRRPRPRQYGATQRADRFGACADKRRRQRCRALGAGRNSPCPSSDGPLGWEHEERLH